MLIRTVFVLRALVRCSSLYLRRQTLVKLVLPLWQSKLVNLFCLQST
jgi:hypothetical protein